MSEKLQISPEAQQVLMRLQTFQQTANAINMQKETLVIQKIEYERALEELSKVGKEEVFKAVGPILIKSTKDVLVKDMRDKMEDIDVRTKSLDKQEEKLAEKMKESQQKLQEMLMAKPSKSEPEEAG